MDRRSFENGKSNFDVLDADGGDVAALLSALPRVEAPQNFDFRVKAAIAAGVPGRSGLVPFLKLAAPVSLVLVIAAFVVFYGTLPSQNEVPGVITSVQNEAPSAPDRTEQASAPQSTASGPQVPEDPVAPERASAETERRSPVRRTTTGRSADRAQGGSVDRTLESANTIMPPGFKSVSPSRNSNTNIGNREIPVSEIFQMLGIGADFADSGWKVRSIAAGTMADRAGVKSGDLIEAINGSPLVRVTTFTGKFEGRSISVKRDDRTVILNLNK